MINKITASTLYGYNYNLKDSEGNVWSVDGVHAGKLILHSKGKRKVIGCSFDQIGTTYKILARPLKMLTKEIEGKVPLIECARIAMPDVSWNLASDFSVRGTPEDRNRFAYRKDLKSFVAVYHGLTISTETAPNQLQCFQYLYSLNFNIGFPEGTTTNLI